MFKFLKWYFKTAFRILGIFPMFRWLPGNRRKEGQISFNGEIVTDKDFIVLSKEFAKDSTNAYYKSRAFSYADVPTFEAVDKHYAKDKDKVYYCDEYREGQSYYLTKRQTILELEKADPASFVSLENGFAKDRSYAWFEGISFKVKDVGSLVGINNHFAKDDVSAYLNLRPIAGSQGKTFELLDRNFAKDAAHIYYYGYTGEMQHNICILPCSPASFEILDYRFSKDAENVFFLGFKIKEADGQTFQMLDEGYSKDKDHVYFMEKSISDADPESFAVYEENGMFGHDVNYARDKDSVFMDEKKISADVATFKVLGENYGCDAKYVYYKSKIVKQAIPASFEVYPHDIGDADAQDAHNRFHEGIKVVSE